MANLARKLGSLPATQLIGPVLRRRVVLTGCSLMILSVTLVGAAAFDSAHFRTDPFPMTADGHLTLAERGDDVAGAHKDRAGESAGLASDSYVETVLRILRDPEPRDEAP